MQDLLNGLNIAIDTVRGLDDTPPMRNAVAEQPSENQPNQTVRETQTIEVSNVQEVMDYLDRAPNSEKFQVWKRLQSDLGFDVQDVPPTAILERAGLVSLGVVAALSAAKWLAPGIIVFALPVKGLMVATLLVLGVPAILFRNNPSKTQFLLLCALGFLFAVVLGRTSH